MERYKLNAEITEQDYYDYNKFVMFRSPYGRKQIKSTRLFIAILCLILFVVFFVIGGFSVSSFISSIPYLILLVIMELLVMPIFKITLNMQLKNLKKSGKLIYSPSSVIDFYDDKFIETTDEGKTEFVYAAVERVSVVADKEVYIHINQVLAYIISMQCFNSKEQYEGFLKFLEEKNLKLERYSSNK